MFPVKLVFALLIGGAFAYPRFDESGRIVGGTDDIIENIPWQVSLQWNQQHICGGSILNTNTILTAAHCVDWDLDVTPYGIRAGATDRRFGGQFIHAASITMHEEYDDWYLWNDIAIIKLQAPLVYGTGVQPIQLPPVNLHVPAPTPVQLSGWGALVYQGSSPDIVQTVIKPIVSMESCAASYGADEVDPATQICSGEEGRDACQGDSGGGLIYDGQVIGIVSWGYGCAFAGYPTVYTRVASFYSWIEVQM